MEASKYKLDKALNRLTYTLTKGNKPNESDVTAFNEVLLYLNKQESEVVNNNKLFAKLYILFLTQTLRHYDTNIFSLNLVNSDLHSKLDKNLDLFYTAFHNDLINRQLELLIDKWNDKGISREDVIKEQKEFEDKYTKDYVTLKLNEMINAALVVFS